MNESTHDLTVGVSSLDRTSSDSGKPTALQSGFYRDKERLAEVNHYTEQYGEKHDIVKLHLLGTSLRLYETLENCMINQADFAATIIQHFDFATSFFSREETVRAFGEKSANLYYHNKHHAVYQAGFDGVQVAKGILLRDDFLSKHLTLEGALAIILGAIYHDTGYVTAVQNPQNYASLTPVHVEASKKTFQKAIEFLGLPEGINRDRVVKLGIIGIHNTYFPFTDKKKNERQKLLANFSSSEEKKEAMIVALSVQLADLGGQTARVDYFPALLKNLRDEMEAANPGSGIQIIGKDHELAKKCKGFLDFVVKPTVGKTANAFLGKDNTFSEAWNIFLPS